MSIPKFDFNLSASVLPIAEACDPETPVLEPLPIRKLFEWTDNPHCPLELKFDWSSLESFLSCNRAARYKLVDSRIPHGGSALVFGAAMHAALEIFYRHKHEYDVPKITQLAGEAIQAEYAKNAHVQITDYRTADLCFSNFLLYIAEKQNELVEPFQFEGKPLVEFTFAYPMGVVEIPVKLFQEYGFGTLTSKANIEELELTRLGKHATLLCRLTWSGIIDLFAVMGESRTLRIMDHKTSSVISDALFDSFQIAMQPVGYVTAARAAFPDLEIDGFALNLLACRKPTKTGVGFETHRRHFTYSKEQEDEFRTDLLALIEEFLHNLSTGVFPKKTTWCAGKYGACPYLQVCSAPTSLRSTMLASGLFSDNTWKP